MLKILVIEDSAIHQEAARRQLAGHDITIVSTCKSGQEQLEAEWDVVLTDMMIPWNEHSEELSLGMTLAMLALKKGIKKIAVVTDADHHQDMNSRALDSLGTYESDWRTKTYFTIGDSRIYVTNGMSRVADATTLRILSSDELYSEEGKVKYPLTGGPYNSKFENTTRVKSWAEVLQTLSE